jgi:hypothetical protein
MRRNPLTEKEAQEYLLKFFRSDLRTWFNVDSCGWKGCGIIANLGGTFNTNRPYNRIIIDARRSHVFAAAFCAMLEQMRSINDEKGLDGVSEYCRCHQVPMCSAGLAGLDQLPVCDMLRQAELVVENKNNLPFYEGALNLFRSLVRDDQVF